MNTRHLLVIGLCATLATCKGSEIQAPNTQTAVRLVFQQGPTRTLAGRPMNAVVVGAVDAQGQLDSAAVPVVALSLQGAAAAALGGVVARAAVGGIATFSDIVVNTAGSALVLVASAPGLGSIVSAPFRVEALPIVIDSTALHLTSDSAALAAGTLIFDVRSASAPVIDSGRVIVGTENGGFVRRVVHVDRVGSTVRYQTVQASLDEIVQNDSLVVHLSLTPGSQRSARQIGLVPSAPPRFIPATPAITGSDGDYLITDLVLFGTMTDGLVVSSAHLSLQPSVDLRVVWGVLAPRSAHLAVTGTMSFDAATKIGFSRQVGARGSVPLGTVVFPFAAPVGPFVIPGTFSIAITLEWSVSAQGRALVQFGWTSTASSTVGVDWTSGVGFTPLQTSAFSFTPQLPTPSLDATATARVGLRATPRVVIAGSAGGELHVEPFAEGTATADAVANRYSTSCHSAVDIGFDLDLTIASVTIGTFGRSTTILDTPWPICATSGPLRVLTVTGISPANGPLAGGTPVTITGTNFAAPAAAMIGGNALTNLAVVSATQITGTTPAGPTAGAKDVVITSNGLTGTCTTCFTYALAPVLITGISPSSGPTTGGTSVTLTGTSFVAGATATIGGTAVTNVTVVSGTSITGTTPAGTAGAKNVVVTTSAGSGTCTGCFTYVATTAAWCGANLDFSSGALPSGWSVSLIRSGPGLANGRLEADPVDAGAWLLAPGAPSAGTTQVTVEFDANLVEIYWGMGPQVAFETGSTFFAASSGTATYNFGLNKVTFVWQRGYSPVENQTQPGSVIRIDTLPFTYGTYHHRIDVTNAGSAYAITTSGGQFVARSSVGAVSGFSLGAITRFGLGVYTTSDASFWVDNLKISCQATRTAPTVTLVSPNSGPLAGGTSVTLTGTNFMAGAVVAIGGNALTNVTVVSSTSITGTTPAGTAGAKDVVVTTIAGSGTCAGCFTYSGSSSSTLRRVLLLTRGASDSTTAHFKAVLDARAIPYTQLATSAISASSNLDSAVILAGFDATPSELASFGSVFQGAVNRGSRLIMAGYGSYVMRYAGIGTVSSGTWGPAVNDAVYFVKPADTSSYWAGISTWDPPVLPDNPAHLVWTIGAGQSYTTTTWTPPSALTVRRPQFWELGVYYGYGGLPTNSSYCVAWGQCTQYRSVGLDGFGTGLVEYGAGIIIADFNVPVTNAGTKRFTYGPAADAMIANQVTLLRR